MALLIDVTHADEEPTHRSSLSPAAKRSAAPEGGSPPYKSRRRSFSRSKASQKSSGELLETTDTLEQRLHFVSHAADSNDSESEACLGGIVSQMQKMGIRSPTSQKMEAQSKEHAETHRSLDNGSGCQPEMKEHKGMWRFFAQPGSLSDIHTTEEDGWQIVDEYSVKTPPRQSPTPSPERTCDAASEIINASKSNPVFYREDTSQNFQWRVENLPYPSSTYTITADAEKHQIVIRTSNRKYFKRIDVAEIIDRALQLNDRFLTWNHFQNTLVVSYEKPTCANVQV